MIKLKLLFSRIQIVTIAILGTLTMVLICFGCYASPPTLSDTEKFTEMNNCTYEYLTEFSELHILNGDSCYFMTHSPMDFLHDLRLHPSEPAMITNAPDGWITYDDADELIHLINSNEPAAPVISPLSSFWLPNITSTIGNEALFLLEGYRTGYYPPELSSLIHTYSNTSEMKIWWDLYGKSGILSEQDAIRIVQKLYPDLKNYPSDQFPQKVIKTEKTLDGWYVGFILEGSGVPIISARCFHVGNDRNVNLTGFINNSVLFKTSEFSPEICGCKS